MGKIISTDRTYQPSHRVSSAMQRLTRDKWMHPKTVREIGFKLAKCASSMPCHVTKYAYSNICEVTGMIRGFPPFWLWDEGYGEWLKKVKNIPVNSKKVIPEISILITKMRYQK